jgi:uracil-DNA glycosylase family 4
MSGLSREDALAALHWLVESGADEAIGELPVNRLLPPAPTVARQPAPEPPRSIERTSSHPVTRATVESAEKIAAACTTLAELKQALTDFEGCELKRFATNTVFADGNPAGGIMFIGEAPGADEDRKGLPFVGVAGQLLDRMLASIDLDRKKVYITNIVNWRPPGNRDPSPEEAAICLPFLHRHIELANPKLLVLLGAVPVRHLTGLQGILRSRGRWEKYRFRSRGDEVPVMLTLHPAYLLRQPSAKRLAWQDFLAIAEKATNLGLA